MYHRENPEQTNQTKLKCAQLELDQVVKFYNTANIPQITHKKAAEKIIKLAENLCTSYHSNCKTLFRSHKSKLKRKKVNLQHFKYGQKTRKKLIKNAEDIAFLNSMMEKKVERKMKGREMSKNARRLKSKK